MAFRGRTTERSVRQEIEKKRDRKCPLDPLELLA
jgi:hypothetical protein